MADTDNLEVEDPIALRVREAIANKDEKYLEDFDRGRADGESGADRNDPDYSEDSDRPQTRTSIAYNDGYDYGARFFVSDDEGEKEQPGDDEEEEVARSFVHFQPHPLGGIEVVVRGIDGVTAKARVEMQEAALHVAHLNALLTMGFNAIYAQQVQQAQSARNLYVPGQR